MYRGKEEIKLCLFAVDMIVYIENFRELTKKLLELISDYSRVVGSKINMYQSITFLHISAMNYWN